MSDPNPEAPSIPSSRSSESIADIQPSWKPLFWLAAGLAVVIGLGEVFFDLALEGLGMLGHGIFYAVEGSEELLEDKIEEWFDLDPYHAEIVTAWTMTPVKLLLAFLVLRALWRLGRKRFFPQLAAYAKRQYAAVRLAWKVLGWPLKVLVGVVAVGALAVLV
jgi:hypothetical protein